MENSNSKLESQRQESNRTAALLQFRVSIVDLSVPNFQSQLKRKNEIRNPKSENGEFKLEHRKSKLEDRN
jgi:hypothetical protein